MPSCYPKYKQVTLQLLCWQKICFQGIIGSHARDIELLPVYEDKMVVDWLVNRPSDETLNRGPSSGEKPFVIERI